MEPREYWDIEFPDKVESYNQVHSPWRRNYDPQYQIDTSTEEDMIAGTRERLTEATRLRLQADVPISIHISGGIDSSALAGIVMHLVKEQGEKMDNKDATDRIVCFSISFDKD